MFNSCQNVNNVVVKVDEEIEKEINDLEETDNRYHYQVKKGRFGEGKPFLLRRANKIGHGKPFFTTWSMGNHFWSTENFF